jgi:beta-phosphoglucomutase
VYFDQRINERLRGVSRMESLDILLEQYHGKPLTAAQKEALAERKNEFYREALGQLTPADVTSETLIALNTLRARGYRLAVGSSSKNARFILERIGLTHLFDAVCDGTAIKNSKPDPEVFLKAASALGIPCGECCVIEDARSGIEAARCAGMRAIAYGEHAYELDADDVLPAFMAILDLFPRM